MISRLKGFEPSEIEFILSDSAKEKFPTVLNFRELEEKIGKKLTTSDDIIKFVGKQFTATFPDNEMVERKLTDFEVGEIREEYCVKQEDLVPQRKQYLEETLERIKIEKKRAEEAYNSILREVAELAAQVKKGTTEIRLKSTETFCISLCGYYLTYTYDKVSGDFLLAKAHQISDREKQEMWANDEKNREAMKEIFGIEFPVEEDDEESEENDGDVDNNGNDLPFGGEDDDEDEDD